MPSYQTLLAAFGWFTILTPVAVFASTGHTQQVPLTSDAYVCEHPPYKVHFVSYSPVVIYIRDFITACERAHLLDLGKSTFTRSGITSSSSSSSNSTNTPPRGIRTSQSTTLPPSDPVVACIESRALAFQGLSSSYSSSSYRASTTTATPLEPLQMVKYAPGEHYHFHTDWFPTPGPYATVEQGGNRLSSFFVYVRVEEGTTGGGTNFPRLKAPATLPSLGVSTAAEGDRRDGEQGEGWWCDEGIVDCDVPWDEGLTFRPVEGNAVFWVNLVDDGEGGMRGDERTLHAGMPVVSGGKVGMNIWTREGPVGQGVRGEV